MFATLDKTIADERAALAKDRALVVNLDAPRIRVEQREQRLAELEAKLARAQAEAEQLAAEKADVVTDIDRLSYAKDVTVLITALQPADRYRSGRFHSSVYSQAIAALRDDHETLQTYQQRLAAIDKRLRELGQ